MDGPGITRKVDRGFARAAAVAGFPHWLYRPTDRLHPLRLLDRLAQVKAAFDARPSYKFEIPAGLGDFFRYALVDNSVVQPGDYLVTEEHTLFVALKAQFSGAECVMCNSVLTLRRGQSGEGFGAIQDRTQAPIAEDVLFAGWPGSLLYAGRGGNEGVNIPGGLGDPSYTVLLPPVPECPDPRPGDVLLDERGRRFVVNWWEVSETGWRMMARLLTVA
jgi:hypothetical protein